MYEIKTVTSPFERSVWFDDAVNELLADGWTLKRRELLNVPGVLTESFNVPLVQVLYAELERRTTPQFEEITE